MVNKLTILVTASFIVALSCSSKVRETKEITISTEADTLKAAEFKDKSATCTSILKQYHSSHGIIISNYYVETDSLNIDLNGDKVLDNLLIFSPISLEADQQKCQDDTNPKRKLVEVINSKNGNIIRGIYSNLLSEDGGVMSKYSGIYKTKKGVEIVHMAGALYSWEYKTELIVNKNQELQLSKITKTCSVDGEAKTVEYFTTVLAKNVSITDTLRNDCNCDKIWKEIEQN